MLSLRWQCLSLQCFAWSSERVRQTLWIPCSSTSFSSPIAHPKKAVNDRHLCNCEPTSYPTSHRRFSGKEQTQQHKTQSSMLHAPWCSERQWPETKQYSKQWLDICRRTHILRSTKCIVLLRQSCASLPQDHSSTGFRVPLRSHCTYSCDQVLGGGVWCALCVWCPGFYPVI